MRTPESLRRALVVSASEAVDGWSELGTPFLSSSGAVHLAHYLRDGRTDALAEGAKEPAKHAMMADEPIMAG
jgi:hypothetical protein